MLHKDLLTLLFPIKLIGDFVKLTTFAGGQLDKTNALIDDFLKEIFPDTTDKLITWWERITGLNGDGKPLQTRQSAVVVQLNAKGAVSIADFIALADRLGYTITVKELQAPKAGIAKAGVAKVWPDEIIFVWQVTMSEQHLFDAKAGMAKAGDKIRWKDTTTPLETVLRQLKHAHTEVTFYYP